MLDCTLDYSRSQMKFPVLWFQRVVANGMKFQIVTSFCLCCLIKRYTDDNFFAHNLFYFVLLEAILYFKLLSSIWDKTVLIQIKLLGFSYNTYLHWNTSHCCYVIYVTLTLWFLFWLKGGEMKFTQRAQMLMFFVIPYLLVCFIEMLECTAC